MKHPLQILQQQLKGYLRKAASSEARTIRLSDTELESLKSNFSQLCYEVHFGKLDEVYQELINDKSHRGGVFQERDLNNILIILETLKAAE